MNKQEKIEALKKELEKLQLEATEEKREKSVKQLSEFSNEEKIAIFDAAHRNSMQILERYEEKGWLDDDDERQWAFEFIMNIIARDKKSFWEYFRSIGQ